MQPTQPVVSRGAWLTARLELLKKEKAHSRARDELTRARQALPWVKLEKDYTFDGPDGSVTLGQLFEDKGQLIVQHFMFDTDWDQACKSCSFMADHMDRSVVHIAQRDTAYAVISRAPLAKLEAFKKRMGWTFKWLSSGTSDFSRDFHVSFTEEELENSAAYYNFREHTSFPDTEAPGVSAFAKDGAGTVYHTYSVYGRGLENFMGAYHLLDIVPKGRDEDELSYTMEWLRLKDAY